MREAITPGAQFPDYQLPDHTKTPRRLSDLQGDQLGLPGCASTSCGAGPPQWRKTRLLFAGFRSR